MTKLPKMPKTIYVKWESDDDVESPWLLANENPEVLAESDGDVIVHEYELVRKVRLTNRTTVEPAK